MAVINQETIELLLKVSGAKSSGKAIKQLGGDFSNLGDMVKITTPKIDSISKTFFNSNKILDTFSNKVSITSQTLGNFTSVTETFGINRSLSLTDQVMAESSLLELKKLQLQHNIKALVVAKQRAGVALTEERLNQITDEIALTDKLSEKKKLQLQHDLKSLFLAKQKAELILSEERLRILASGIDTRSIDSYLNKLNSVRELEKQFEQTGQKREFRLEQLQKEPQTLEVIAKIIQIEIDKREDLLSFYNNISNTMGNAISDALIMSVTKGFSKAEKRSPWNSMVQSFGRDFGNETSKWTTTAMQNSFGKDGLLSVTETALSVVGGNLVGGITSGLFGMLSQWLFPVGSITKNTEALNVTTRTIKALDTTMRRDYQNYINLPASFDIGAVTANIPSMAGGGKFLSDGLVYGHAGEVIGQPEQLLRHQVELIDQTEKLFPYQDYSSHNSNFNIVIHQSPGQSANEIVDIIRSEISGSYQRGAHYKSSV